MLQQTRVTTVLPYYQRFLDRFPDVQTLAAASEAEVLELWAGLGYYRRARNLRRAAHQIVSESGGTFPKTLEEIRRLPGVGRYTAAAVYSIAFGGPEPVVDGNVRRVIGRLLDEADAPENFFWQQARLWLAKNQASAFNQALMELGALVCVPLAPLCGKCPVRSHCVAASQGLSLQPTSRTKQALVAAQAVMLVLSTAERSRSRAGREPNSFPANGACPSNASRWITAASRGQQARAPGARLHAEAPTLPAGEPQHHLPPHLDARLSVLD